MRNEIQNSGVVLDAEFTEDIRLIINDNGTKLTPFMKLFWQQQQEAFAKN